MKYITSILTLFVIMACNSPKDKTPDNIDSEAVNQITEGTDGSILIGRINREGLTLDEFSPWYDEGYAAYNPDLEVLEQLLPLMQDVRIVAFIGSWCEDSHREIPNLYRILDKMRFDESQMLMYAVSDDKTEPADLVEKYEISQVPTLIFYKNGKELGRIVEYSIRSLEQDMLDIMSGKDYKHPYSDF